MSSNCHNVSYDPKHPQLSSFFLLFSQFFRWNHPNPQDAWDAQRHHPHRGRGTFGSAAKTTRRRAFLGWWTIWIYYGSPNVMYYLESGGFWIRWVFWRNIKWEKMRKNEKTWEKMRKNEILRNFEKFWGKKFLIRKPSPTRSRCPQVCFHFQIKKHVYFSICVFR